MKNKEGELAGYKFVFSVYRAYLCTAFLLILFGIYIHDMDPVITGMMTIGAICITEGYVKRLK